MLQFNSSVADDANRLFQNKMEVLYAFMSSKTARPVALSSLVKPLTLSQKHFLCTISGPTSS